MALGNLSSLGFEVNEKSLNNPFLSFRGFLANLSATPSGKCGTSEVLEMSFLHPLPLLLLPLSSELRAESSDLDRDHFGNQFLGLWGRWLAGSNLDKESLETTMYMKVFPTRQF